MSNDILAKRLKDLRDSKGYLQKYVADKIGVKSNTLSGYENGTRSPDPDMLVKLARLYDVSTDYLLDNEPTNDDDQFEYYKNKIITEFPDIDLMFKDLANLSGEGLKEVYEFIKFKSQQEKEK